MIRMVFVFLVLFVVFFFGIDAFRKLSNYQKWSLTKLLAYSLLCSMLSIGALIGLVVIF